MNIADTEKRLPVLEKGDMVGRVQRVVLVKFLESSTPQERKVFLEGLIKLKEETDYLLEMTYNQSILTESESELSVHVPNAHWPDFMSTWTFSSMKDLDRFISCDKHKRIAKQYFKPVVDLRIVFNRFIN